MERLAHWQTAHYLVGHAGYVVAWLYSKFETAEQRSKRDLETVSRQAQLAIGVGTLIDKTGFEQNKMLTKYILSIDY